VGRRSCGFIDSSNVYRFVLDMDIGQENNRCALHATEGNGAYETVEGRVWSMTKMRKQNRNAMILAVGCICFLIFPSLCSATDLYVGNFFGNDSGVLKFNGTTGTFESVFVPFSVDSFPLGGAFGSDGNFYVSNSNTDAVLRVNGTTGAFLNTFASGVDNAAGLKFGPNGNLYVVNSSSPGSVTELNGTTGALITLLTGGGLSDPEGIAFGPDGNIYVANGDSIVRFNGKTGAFIDVFVTSGSGGLSGGRDVTFGPDGNLYATSNGATGGVLKYNGTTGAFLSAFVGPGSDLSLPRGLVFGPDGNLYVANFGVGDVLRFKGASGAFIDTFIAAGSGPPPGSGALGGPTFLLFNEPATSVPEPSMSGIAIVGLAAILCSTRKRNAF
jgi:streptogramin lyase